MNRFIFWGTLFCISLICANNKVNAQTLADYRKTQADVSLTYDSNWNPIGKFSIKNISNKTITNIEIIVYYTGYDNYDIFQPTSKCYANMNISPNCRGTLTFNINSGDKKPKSFAITRIRYSDGTVCDR